MGEQVVRRIVCDMCGDDGPTKRFRVTDTESGESAAPDLCAKCQEPLKLIFEHLPTGRGGRARKRVVYDDPGISALKRKAARNGKSAKKATAGRRR